MGGGSSTQKENSRVIQFLPFSTLKQHGSIPKYSDQKKLTVALKELSPEIHGDSLFLFVSHVWLRPSKDSSDWDGQAHPDNAQNDKYRLLVAGVEKLLNLMTKSLKECYLWVDYSCLDQNQSPSEQINRNHMFPIVLSYCDAVITPLVDEEHNLWDWPSAEVQRTFQTVYRSPAWVDYKTEQKSIAFLETLKKLAERKELSEADEEVIEEKQEKEVILEVSTEETKNQKIDDTSSTLKSNAQKSDAITTKVTQKFKTPSERAYLSRAWCRLELFSSSMIPFFAEDSEDRKSKLMNGLLFYKQQMRRPHFIYGAKEHFTGRPPIPLPILMNPLQSPLLEQYHPLDGLMTSEKDKRIIQQIWDEVVKLQLPPVRVDEIEQQAPLNILKPEENKENINNQNGIIDKTSNMLSKSSLGYISSTESRKMLSSISSQQLPPPITPLPTSGVEGQFIKTPFPFNGAFRYQFSNGDVYEGDFRNSQMSGEGRFLYSTGDIYEGEFLSNLQHGKGRYIHYTGDIYEGEFQYGLMHGKGKYSFHSGSYYEGDYQYGLMHGKGKYYNSIDKMTFEGSFCQNYKHGKGKLFFANGDMYEGDFDHDDRKGVGYYYEKSGRVYQQEWGKDQKLLQEKRHNRILLDGNLLMLEAKIDDAEALFIL